jgi:hypothetical protein
MGFVGDATTCAGIDMNEVEQRRGDEPIELQADPVGKMETGEVTINQGSLSTLMEVLGQIFSPKQPAPRFPSIPRNAPMPTLARRHLIARPPTPLPSTCLPSRKWVRPATKQTDTSYYKVTTRLFDCHVQICACGATRARPSIHLGDDMTALRTACLTGFAHRKMAQPIALPSGNTVVITAGDLDKAVAGLLTNHLVASDVNGVTVPAGFTRITGVSLRGNRRRRAVLPAVRLTAAPLGCAG